ncbi:hypothetical protein OG787_49095 [Streptomyces sp. NBC_00075]|uniref:DUF6777 domain-containing protein n=1 Tax=Streptomyces sp. NBC_00075 TaxID=2975641 RepID=UPI0032495F9D
MSVEQPSSDRPSGPPSGPLSGPSQPPAGPPSQPPTDGGSGGDGGDGGGTGEGPGRDRPWWRSAPRIAVLVTSVVAAVALIVVLTRSDGGSGGTSDQAGGEVFLQAADTSGPDPFTESTAKDSSAPPATTPTATVSETATANVVRRVDGGAAGLYGGTRKVASCDVEKQIQALRAAPAKNSAFASVLGLQPARVPGYLRSLTPVQLRMDTRVTNHGYRDSAATTYQAVLQTGTAVLVDDRGRPRVRCACGNPLTDPVRQSAARPRGDAWPSYRTSNVVYVAPAVTVVNIFVVYDPDRRDWFHRHPGDTGGKDRKTDPPVKDPTPSVSSSESSSTPSQGSSEPSSPDSSAPESSKSSESTSEAPGLLPQRSPVPCVSSPTASPAPPAATDTASPSATPCPSASSAPPSSSSPAVGSSSPPAESLSEGAPRSASTSPSY